MKAKNILFGILALLTAGTIGAGGYIIGRESCVRERDISFITPTLEVIPTPDTTPSFAPTTTPSDIEIDTSDWEIYQDNKLGISFKYPKEWKLEKVIELAKNEGWVGSYNYPGLNIWLNFVEKEFASSKPKALENFCNENLPFSFVESGDHMLDCNEIKISTDKDGIIRDSFVCPTMPCPSEGPCGGEPTIDHCEYLRSFITDLNNENYPRFVAGIKWGRQCYEEKCVKLKENLPLEELYSCMKREYENCKRKELFKLQTFDKFIKEIQIGESK